MIVLEFSLSQKAFHRTTVAEMITTNFNNMVRRTQSDYLPVAIFDTDEEVEEFIGHFGDTLKDYSMFQNINGELVVK